MAVQKKAAPAVKKKKVAPARHNSNLTIVLGLLVTIIAGFVFYMILPINKPESLITVSQTIHGSKPAPIVPGLDTEPVAVAPLVAEAAPSAKPAVVSAPKPATAAVPASATPTPTTTNPGVANQLKPVQNSKKEFLYIIQPGETLFRVTQRFNMPREDFKKLNNLADDQLKAGQEVKVKVTALHVIKAGETLTSVAGKYTVDKSLIQKANNLQTDNIALGQQLVIPIP